MTLYTTETMQNMLISGVAVLVTLHLATIGDRVHVFECVISVGT